MSYLKRVNKTYVQSKTKYPIKKEANALSLGNSHVALVFKSWLLICVIYYLKVTEIPRGVLLGVLGRGGPPGSPSPDRF